MKTEQSKKYGTMIPTYFKRKYQIGDIVSVKIDKTNKKIFYLLLEYDLETAKKYGYYRVPFKALHLKSMQRLTLFLNHRTVPLLTHGEDTTTSI